MHVSPLVIRRTVKWGETDPAGMVYTPRFLDYAVEAVEAFYAEVIGVDWYRLRQEFAMGSPLVHASLDFFKPLFPAQPFELVLTVEHVGRSAIAFAVFGRDGDGERCFEARLVTSLIDRPQLKSIRIPDDFRERIEAFRKAAEAGA
jgi:acyl-CoA thioesterase FadM